MAAVRAGIICFPAVFAIGFVLGALRITLLVPRLGVMAAVAVEVPVMLAAAWAICGAVLAWIAVPARARDRLMMGGVALALLWLAEALLAAAMGMTPGVWLATLATPAGVLGVAAQLVFAAFPLLRALTPS